MSQLCRLDILQGDASYIPLVLRQITSTLARKTEMLIVSVIRTAIMKMGIQTLR